MNTRSLIICFLFCCLSFFGCSEEPDASPQEIVRLYQAYMDQNEFIKAAQLSTPPEKKRLEELEQMIGAYADSTVLTTSFERIDCTIKADSAICDCLLADQYESYEAEFVLLKRDKEWLIDLPREEDVEYDEEIEAVLDSLIRETSEN